MEEKESSAQGPCYGIIPLERVAHVQGKKAKKWEEWPEVLKNGKEAGDSSL